MIPATVVTVCAMAQEMKKLVLKLLGSMPFIVSKKPK